MRSTATGVQQLQPKCTPDALPTSSAWVVLPTFGDLRRACDPAPRSPPVSALLASNRLPDLPMSARRGAGLRVSFGGRTGDRLGRGGLGTGRGSAARSPGLRQGAVLHSQRVSTTTSPPTTAAQKPAETTGSGHSRLTRRCGRRTSFSCGLRWRGRGCRAGCGRHRSRDSGRPRRPRVGCRDGRR
jgi:hypothetical protein